MRVNFDNMFLKFSNMNLCSEQHMKEFAELPLENKILLNNQRKTKYACEVYWGGESNEHEILNDSTQYPGNLNICKIFNRKKEKYPDVGMISRN